MHSDHGFPPVEGGALNRRYIATLAVVALAILVVGTVARNWLSSDRTASQAPPSEASALQQLSQEREVRRRFDFLEERVSGAARWVEWRADVGASSVRWPGSAALLASSRTTPVFVAAEATTATAGAPLVSTDSTPRRWSVVVARTPSSRVVALPITIGGRSSRECGGVRVEAYVVDIPLTDATVGAGIFDVEGRLSGMIVQCEGTIVALPANSVTRLLAAQATPEMRLMVRLGVEVDTRPRRSDAPAGADARALEVTAVRLGGIADRLGLSPGDVIDAVDSLSVGNAESFARAIADSTVPHRITRRRGATATIALLPATGAPDDAPAAPRQAPARLGVTLAAHRAEGALEVRDVAPGSPAAAAGLRAGDLVRRIGGVSVTTVAAARRLLDEDGEAPILFVVERDSVLRAVQVERPAPRQVQR